MSSAIIDFVTKLENVALTRDRANHLLKEISSNAPASSKAKKGYPQLGVIKGCPFIVGTLDGGKIAGREDLVEGFRFKMGIN